jgi:hypothetical protein
MYYYSHPLAWSQLQEVGLINRSDYSRKPVGSNDAIYPSRPNPWIGSCLRQTISIPDDCASLPEPHCQEQPPPLSSTSCVVRGIPLRSPSHSPLQPRPQHPSNLSNLPMHTSSGLAHLAHFEEKTCSPLIWMMSEAWRRCPHLPSTTGCSWICAEVHLKVTPHNRRGLALQAPRRPGSSPPTVRTAMMVSWRKTPSSAPRLPLPSSHCFILISAFYPS